MDSGEACVVCGGADIQMVSSAVGPRFYCSACFHGWRGDRPAYAYSNTAMCSLGTSGDRVQSQIRFFSRFAPPGAAILEIGCATGELAAATRTALTVSRYEAIELSPAADQARSHVDELYKEPLRTLLAKGRIQSTFDLILMSHVLEHIDDPASELKAMAGLLRPHGAIFLEVPNGPGNRRLPIDDNLAHLHFFSATSLTRLLAGQGLEIVAAATDVRLDARYADSLQVIARPFSPPSWSPTLLSDHPALAGETEIVVWGAGSLAKELLANFFDARRIAFFIDRDIAKHEALCLGRPVRGPDALGPHPRTVLINSIDFADAIIADIRRVSPGVDHRLVPIGDLLE
jgi:SAM-dependent methyltransferase